MMQGTYYKEWSRMLGREMEFKVYGTAGVPVLALPARGGRFYDWENNGMPEAVASLLSSGKLQLFGGQLSVSHVTIVTIAASAISGTGYPVGGTEYVNLSMFLAFAFLFPDTRLLLFFFIPVKIKWLAWLDIAVFVIGIVQSLLAGSWLGAILPVVALLNFLMFL